MTRRPATPRDVWSDANRRYLAARLAIVRETLGRAVRQIQAVEVGPVITDETMVAEVEAARLALTAPAALDRLASVLDLSPPETDIILLCAGIDLDPRFRALCKALQGAPQPTFGLARTLFPALPWRALTPVAPLRYWRLIEPDPGAILTDSPLRLDERVLHFLNGVAYLDERLQATFGFVPPPASLPPSQLETARQIAACWRAAEDAPQWPVIQLVGAAGEKQHIAAVGCEQLGLQLHVLRGADVPADGRERASVGRLWEREALLSDSALLLEWEEPAQSAVLAFVERHSGMLILAGRDPLVLTRPTFKIDVARPSTAEQRELWRSALGASARRVNGELDQIVSHFQLGVEEIRTASESALGSARNGQPLAAALWSASRVEARRRLDDLAQRIEGNVGWSDLVLPAPQIETLRDIAAQMRQRRKIYEEWGFAAKSPRGLGLAALFAGPSGTGKTLAAEVLAGELRLDLYRIDLSQVVSKYIGETEKNLRRVFDAAQDSGAVLLFDEADALFGKRSDVKDSHDRYANIEVSYLLQRMESYRGLAILTTNMKAMLDPAFFRRLRFVVNFPFPDTTQRAAIWRQIFPPRAPVEGLDISRLAQLSVSGGNIRNIALQASFLAADADEPVRMAHLLRAARQECAKLDKPISEAEIRGWT